MFYTLSEVRLVFCILLQLNILCTSLVKPYYAEKNNLPFTCHGAYLIRFHLGRISRETIKVATDQLLKNMAIVIGTGRHVDILTYRYS